VDARDAPESPRPALASFRKSANGRRSRSLDAPRSSVEREVDAKFSNIPSSRVASSRVASVAARCDAGTEPTKSFARWFPRASTPTGSLSFSGKYVCVPSLYER
jgi:hypothetical protein